MTEPPTITWAPTPHKRESCTLTAFVRYINANHNAQIPLYDQTALHKWSVSHAHTFWRSVAVFSNLPLRHRRDSAIDASLPFLLRQSVLPGFSLNFAEAVLRNALISPDKPAILHATESSPLSSVSFASLLDDVSRLVTGLRRERIVKGDHIAAVVANTPHAVAAMLSTAAIGAIWSSCSPDFGAAALVSRLSQTNPRVLFYSPSYIYKGRTYYFDSTIPAILHAVPSITTLVALPGPCSSIKTRANRYTWGAFTSVSRPIEFTTVAVSDPLVVMFSSGTTGVPKCIVQGPGIIINQVKEHALHLDITRKSTVFYATSTGWMLFNWLVACLVSGATILLYDGAALPPSDPLRMVDLAAKARVTHFGSGAKYFHTLSRQVTVSNPPIPTLTTLMATGSPSTHEHFQFARVYFGPVQYVSMSGGTEINGCFALGTPWKPVCVPQLQCSGLGMDVAVFNDSGVEVVGESGELVCRNAAPCMPLYFLGDKSHLRYRASYFDRFGDKVWAHGDFAVHTAQEGFIITGRSDSTLNPGGVRIGTADIYAIVEAIDEVESALVADQTIKGDCRMILLIVLCDGFSLNGAMKKRICQLLRTKLSPRHVPHAIVQISQIPCTFSGKKCEIPVKRMLQGFKITNKEAVQNPMAFEEIMIELRRHGLLPQGPSVAATTAPICKL